MSADRIRRSSDEITAGLLVARLNVRQLLPLVGQEGYEKFQSKILERLQPVSGFGLDDFRKVHPSSRDCNIEEVEIGQKIHLHGDTEFGSWGAHTPLKKLKCNLHNVTSIEFFDYGGERQEGPF